MSRLQELGCAGCGAPIDVREVRGALAACPSCGAAFRVPPSLTPEPSLGDLLLGADFRNPDVPGWILSQPGNLEFRPGSPAELWAAYPASRLIHPVVRTAGPFDDFDAGLTIRFISGALSFASAGLEVRSWDDGDYVARISPQGTFSLGWHEGTAWGGDMISWTRHPALRTGWGAANRLRLMARGQQLRLYLNGVLAASLHDGRFAAGRVRVILSPGTLEPAVAAFADLQIRDTD
jgi:hypothetical protein